MSEAVQERKERRISSPEELHDYMHVTGPGLWIMLALIIVLMAALIYFASTVKLENLMEVSADVTDDGAGGGRDEGAGRRPRGDDYHTR